MARASDSSFLPLFTLNSCGVSHLRSGSTERTTVDVDALALALDTDTSAARAATRRQRREEDFMFSFFESGHFLRRRGCSQL